MTKTVIIHLGTALASHGKHHLKIFTLYSQPLNFLLLFKSEYYADH